MRASTCLALLFAAFGAAGCQRVSVADDLDLDLDWFPLSGPSDDLHSPYVRGATVRVFAHSTDDGERMIGWRFETSNPAVFQLVSKIPQLEWPGLAADFHAAGAGTATLRVLDDRGHVMHEREVTVRVPDHARVLAHGPLLIGRPDEAETKEARVLAGGTATYLIQWFDGTLLLNGHGVLSVEAPDGIVATPETTSFVEAREWLRIVAAAPGTATVKLYADGAAVPALPVVAVAADAIQDVTIRGEDESRAHTDQWLTTLAEAFDSSGQPVLGIDYDWDVDGTRQAGQGDLYRYQYRPGSPRQLGAHFSGHVASAAIHAGVGFVDSSNHIGCSTGGAPGRPGRLPLLLAFAPLALVVRRVRRRGGRPTPFIRRRPAA